MDMCAVVCVCVCSRSVELQAIITWKLSGVGEKLGLMEDSCGEPTWNILAVESIEFIIKQLEVCLENIPAGVCGKRCADDPSEVASLQSAANRGVALWRGRKRPNKLKGLKVGGTKIASTKEFPAKQLAWDRATEERPQTGFCTDLEVLTQAVINLCAQAQALRWHVVRCTRHEH